LQIEFGADQRGAPKGRDYPACLRFSSNGLAYRRAQPCGVGAFFCQPARKSAYQVAVCVAPKHFEAREAALAKAVTVVLEGTFLRLAH